MATKVDKAPTKKPAQETGQDDLEILHPERVVKVNGQEVTVREYGFVEGLRLLPKIKPMLDDLYKSVANGVPSLDDVLLVLAEHTELVVELIEISIDEQPGFAATLSDKEGDELMMTWWAVNGPFFMRNVTRKVITAKLVESRLRDGQTSISSLSNTDTENTTSPPIPAAR